MIYFSLDEPDDMHLISMEEVYRCTKVIDDTSRCMRLGHCTDNKTRQPIPSNPSSTNPLPAEWKSKPVCGNCGGVHPTKDCFQTGGAMEGK